MLKPWSRLTTPSNTKVTALQCHAGKAYLGLSNGDIMVMTINNQAESSTSQPNSIRSFRSFTDAKHMFSDNKTSNSLVLELTFPGTMGLAITSISILPMYNEPQHSNSSRTVLLISSDDQLHVYELVGAHFTLIQVLEEARGCVASSFVSIDQDKLLVVGSRKKALIYKIEQRTRNIYDFKLVASHLYREKVKHLCTFDQEKQALIATVHSFHLLDLRGTYATRELPKDFANVGSFVQPSSFSYFGLSNNGPAIKLIPCGPDRTLVVNDLQTAILRPSSGFHGLEESKIVLSAVPAAIEYLYPCYILVTYTKTLEVVDIDSGRLIQEFKHLLNSSQISVALQERNAVIGAGSLVFHFSVVSAQKQLDQYLSTREGDTSADARAFGIDRAITYISSLDSNDIFFQDKGNPASSAIKTRQLFLRDLQKEKAVLYFERYSKYSEALVDIASEWVISLTDILPLFPDFLNGSSKRVLNSSIASNKRRSSIRNVTIEDLELFKIAEKGNYIDEETNGLKTATSNTAATRFNKAVNNFIVYLTDQRRIHFSLLSSTTEIPSIRWKGVELSALDIYPGLDPAKIKSMLNSCVATIDTTLFLCYYHTKPMLLGPLLRLPNNKCNAKVVNDCLLRKIHLHNEELEGFLSQLLDFYYGRELHDDALAMLKDLAHDEDKPSSNEFEKLLRSPVLSTRYLQKLTNECLDLVFKYSTWILKESNSTVAQAELIFMNESYECESYDNFKVFEFLKGISKTDNLAIRYLEWLLNETDILELQSRKKHVLKFTTKLSLFYLRKLKLLNCSNDDFYKNSWYTKLYALLESKREFEPWTILKNIPTSEDKYLRFSIFIYRRLGEHQKSVDILFNQLADLHGAMAYCEEVYEQPNGQQIGTELLHKLLDDLLMHYDENQDAVVTLLLTQGHRMSTLNILAALPNSFSLHKLNLFLEATTHMKQDELYKTRMTSQLYKVGSTKLHYQLLMAQQDFCIIDSNRELCQVCHKSIAGGVLCAGDNHRAVHYGCGLSKT